MLPAIMAGLTAAPKVVSFVRGLKSKGAVDSVLDLAESLTGKKGTSAIDAINQSPELALQFEQAVMEHKETILAMEHEAKKHASAQVTERWKADMSADSWLSKNIRPITLASLVLLLGFVIVASTFGKTADTVVVDLLKYLAGIVFAAYFIGRACEKGVQIHDKHKYSR